MFRLTLRASVGVIESTGGWQVSLGCAIFTIDVPFLAIAERSRTRCSPPATEFLVRILEGI